MTFTLGSKLSFSKILIQIQTECQRMLCFGKICSKIIHKFTNTLTKYCQNTVQTYMHIYDQIHAII
uniref:Uncharacterized protein n=1 Tax=Octopus bimaculoides TaxID=37653 RepID=A0A0L8IHX6_OCTBM